MNKVQKAFANGKAFIPFITAGDPSLEITEELVIRMAEEGADLIELGIPFSDPIAEGLVIQRADERALAGGATTDKIFDMVKRIRQVCSVPLAFMTYMNPIFTYGTERFMKNCQESGIDAIIVPDVPFEEKDELLPYCSNYSVELISLIAPTSQHRIRQIASEAQGFVYCVSSMGVTGVRQEISSDVEEMVKLVKQVKDIPCAIGFGISTPEQAAKMVQFSDGAIVGSAIVKIVEQYGVDCVPYVADYVRRMKKAVKQGV
ncbi:tryptophan synthase subunit alpha [Desulfosporosinus sp.]|uniref:tryptophan synthase subunit alpha n=1 Tax=Desulfosporosinus sp. TaxID=157907 RepID=UPI0025BDC684|nr:tryptophan synthase subunit alpha [Desulfosporosinus sp.]MBC2722204.1 tryptophan synthase subunit alpha [Desulfosporosinus sp.]MBC2728542.1 tryptophan synthase subunit alpha [Desulfosporosinus sp.]